MKLSKQAISKIDRQLKLRLAMELEFTEFWMTKLIKKNRSNGPLTTAAAIRVISEATGLSEDKILEAGVSTVK